MLARSVAVHQVEAVVLVTLVAQERELLAVRRGGGLGLVDELGLRDLLDPGPVGVDRVDVAALRVLVEVLEVDDAVPAGRGAVRSCDGDRGEKDHDQSDRGAHAGTYSPIPSGGRHILKLSSHSPALRTVIA